MSKQIQLDVVTPDANFFSELIDMVIVRTTEGDMGILYNHEPIVAPLSIGAIKIKRGSDYKVAACSGGFVNVEIDKVTIVTDTAEWANDIDDNRAISSKKRAEERLAKKDDNIDIDRARVSLRRAINRIRISENYMSKDLK